MEVASHKCDHEREHRCGGVSGSLLRNHFTSDGSLLMRKVGPTDVSKNKRSLSKTMTTVHGKTLDVPFAMTRALSVMNAPFGSPRRHLRRPEDSELHRVEGTGTFHPGASRNERERSNEQERIANDWFTAMVVGGSVTAR
jgi:hypothetical protein